MPALLHIKGIDGLRYRARRNRYARRFERGLNAPETACVMAPVIERAEEKRIVVYPSIMAWDHYLFQRPHQMFLEMARRGVTVVFITPDPVGDRVENLREIEPNLFLVGSPALTAHIRDLPVWLWVGWTPAISLVSCFPHARLMYELIDDLEILAFHCTEMERDHRKLVSAADVVMASAGRLHESMRAERPDALLVPNGVAMRDFACRNGAPVPEDLAPVLAREKPVIGYYGAISPWLDYGLIAHAVKQLPGMEFVFIGPSLDGAAASLPRAENIHWLGPKRYEELKYYLYRFDVATIPFRIDRTTHAVSPLKLFEYMAGGKPVVARDLEEIARYPEVLRAETYSQWEDRLQQAVEMGKQPCTPDKMRRVAGENSWARRVDVVLEAMDKAEAGGKRTAASARAPGERRR